MKHNQCLAALIAVLLVAFSCHAQTVVTTTTPYFENFESGPGAWSPTGFLWTHGTPSKPGFTPAPSGTKVFVTGLSLNYPNNADESLTATFDFTSLTSSPILKFQLKVDTEEDFDGMQVEIDDGTGFRKLGGDSLNFEKDWYSGFTILNEGFAEDNGGYRPRALRLDGTAGKIVVIRMRFVSDVSVRDRGVAIDDISIVADLTPVAIDDATSYVDDLEASPGPWKTQGSTWEHGTPSDGLQSPSSGTKAWCTTLAGNYSLSTEALLEAAFDARQMTADAVLLFSIDCIAEAEFDGLHIDIDRGQGYELLGGIGQGINFYNDPETGQFGEPGFAGTTGGFVRALVRLNGTAGSLFALRFRFSSDTDITLTGVVIDDIRVERSSLRRGTEDDVDLRVSKNFADLLGGSVSTDAVAVAADDFVTVRIESSAQTAVGLPYVLAATFFVPGIDDVPELTFDPATIAANPLLDPSRVYARLAGPNPTVLVFSGQALGLGLPPVFPSSGVGFTFMFPASLIGTSIQFQAVILDGTFGSNGLYGATQAVSVHG